MVETRPTITQLEEALIRLAPFAQSWEALATQLRQEWPGLPEPPALAHTLERIRATSSPYHPMSMRLLMLGVLHAHPDCVLYDAPHTTEED